MSWEAESAERQDRNSERFKQEEQAPVLQGRIGSGVKLPASIERLAHLI